MNKFVEKMARLKLLKQTQKGFKVMNMLILKRIRLEMIQDDIEQTTIFPDEYERIQQAYLDAETEQELFPIIEAHDELNRREAKILIEWADTIEGLKVGSELH